MTSAYEEYRDVDEDAIMSELTEDELAQLKNEIEREILEKPPDLAEEDEGSYVYSTTSSDEDSESEEEEQQIEEEEEEQEEEEQKIDQSQPIKQVTSQNPTQTKGKPEAFARGKLDRTQLKPLPYTALRHKSGGRHTFKLPALKKTTPNRAGNKQTNQEGKGNELKNELIQAVSKRNKKRTKRANSSGIGLNRRMNGPPIRPRRNSKVIRYRDGNEHQVDAAIVNRNVITDEMINLRPRLRKVEVKEPKLVLPEELHGVSFKRITAGAKKLQDEDDMDPEAVNSEDGDVSRNSAYDADVEVTPSLSDESYAILGDDNDEEQNEDDERLKALSECSEAPSDGMTMASTASTSAESCDVFGELSINPNSVEEMVERIGDNDPMLTEVNLNNIHDVPIERFEELAEAMQSNTHVASLSLANTGLTDRAARAMAAMLKKNKKLKKLNLESNFITGEGALKLVSSLRKNNCLIELLLDNQRHMFGAKVEFEFAKMLKENKSLLKFGYQFANPGPRMATSNILTKNMDIVRKQRVAEEKKRVQSGQSKRPVLRRQPSSEWYRKEKLGKIRSLQEHARQLGLDPNGKIGEKEVEKVLQNMNPEEVSLLERWFTSKLLGMVDKPPAQTEQEKEVGSKEEPKQEEEKKETNRGREPKKMDKTKLSPEKNNLLRPPSKSPKRAKSPVANRGDLMQSIRDGGAKLKKVQVRPFQSPTRFEHTDSDSSDVKPARFNVVKSASKIPEQKTDMEASPKIDAPTTKPETPPVLTKPTILKTAPSVDEGMLKNEEEKTERKPSSPQPIEQTQSSPSGSDVGSNVASSLLSSSPEVREWQEGEEYDSDEYEVVEVEVTDSEGEEQDDASDNGDKSEDNGATLHSSGLHTARSPSPKPTTPSPSVSSRGTPSPKPKSSLLTRVADSKPEPFGNIRNDRPDPNPYAAVLNRQNSSGKPDVYNYLDSKLKSQNSPSSSRSSPVSLRSSLSPKNSPKATPSPRGSPRTPLSPSTPRSPLSQPGARRLDIARYNRNNSNNSNASTDSSRSGSQYSSRSPQITRPTRPTRRTEPEEDLNICPKAMSTIESFFNF